MKPSLLSTAILGFSLLFPSQVNAAAFSAIYSFGDSLTDTGNVFAATQEVFPFPPSFPIGEYFQGRFSNGLVWIEYLKNRLGIPLVNSAFGGATTGTVNTLNNFLGIPEPGLPGLQQQIASFAFNNPIADANGLYVVWAGANDYLPNASFFPPYNTPDIPLNNIRTAVDTLVGIGAMNIMVVNLPDLGKLPLTKRLNADGFCPPNVNTSEDADCLNELTEAHNAGLINLFSSISPDINIFQVDINTTFNQILANPGQFGFTNVTDACYIFPTPSCNNSNDYFFWDRQHPTTEGHRIIGALAFNALGIPEPSMIIGLVTLGILGIFTGKKHKAK